MSNIIDLLKTINKDSNINDIIKKFNSENKINSQSNQGNIYEKLWDIIIKTGFSEFTDNNFIHYNGNINQPSTLEEISNLKNYFKKTKIFSKNTGGSSDITIRKKDGTWIFISSKYPKTKENIKEQKNIKYFEIQDILAVIESNKNFYGNNYEIYLLVHDKSIVKGIFDRSQSTNKHINKSLKGMFDLNDLIKCFNIFLQYYDCKINNINKLFGNKLLPLIPRFHQRFTTIKILKLIEEGYKQFLYGWKCRAGKTYGIGYLLSQFYKQYKIINVLIITPAPTETISQFTEDLFHKYIDFTNINIYEIKKGSQLKDVEFSNKLNNIIICSKQLLDKYINDNKIINIIDLNLNFIIFDENHNGGTTKKSSDILTTYSKQNTVKIYLTATYNKSLYEWNISDNCQFYWDIEDEQFCKKRDIINLEKKHGSIINKILNDSNLENELSSYDKMPSLELITTMMDSYRYQLIKNKIKDTKYGFSMETLFSLNKNQTNFNYPNEVQQILSYISGSNKEQDYPNGNKSIFGRIKTISNNKNSRTTLNNKNFTSQLWFLPFGIGMNIDKVSSCLEKLMMNDTIISKYKILIINSKKEYKLKNLKKEIKLEEKLAKKNNKDGLIILAGNQCSLGITLPLVDCVFLLNNTMSSDRIFQMMYRCMSESEDGSKKCGFVVDLNLSRVLNTILDYNVHHKNMNIEDKIKYIIEFNLINIDSDYFESKDNKTDIINKILEIWKNDPINYFKNLLRKVEQTIIELDTNDQKILNQSFLSSNASNKINIDIKFDEDNSQEIENGKDKKINTEKNTKDEEEINEIKEKEISFTKDILPFIIPLSCILTINDSNKDFIEILDTISKNKELTDVFEDQSFIWWNKKDIIKIINNMVKKYVKKNSDTYNIVIQFKMSLKSLIDKPNELLEYIDNCLKPKDIEKKKYGEVFTPMNLVNEMLDKLDEYYKKENKKSIFTEKEFKWYDPATGMGNFPIAVYLRLMEGLKSIIKDEKERKKHILENMLYMSELNKKNVFICRQIFDINNEYKLNLYQGDSLELDTNKIFKVDKFNIILGNPPYNASGTKATGNTIWQEFLTLSINENLINNGYLCFIHPCGWRKPNTTKGKFNGLYNLMAKYNTILYLEIHNTKDGMKTFNCGTRYDWYILQKKKSNDKTNILDEKGKKNLLDIKKYDWLGNYDLDIIDKLLAKNNDAKCEILQSMSAYEPRKKWISSKKTNEFKYPVVHSTPKTGIRYVWSNRNDNGFYGISKIIFGESGIYNALIDINGEYAMSQGAMAIKINNLKEGEQLKQVLESTEFKKILNACSWSSFRIEWNMFSYFTKEFYKEFLKNKDKIMKNVSNSK